MTETGPIWPISNGSVVRLCTSCGPLGSEGCEHFPPTDPSELSGTPVVRDPSDNPTA